MRSQPAANVVSEMLGSMIAAFLFRQAAYRVVDTTDGVTRLTVPTVKSRSQTTTVVIFKETFQTIRRTSYNKFRTAFYRLSHKIVGRVVAKLLRWSFRLGKGSNRIDLTQLVVVINRGSNPTVGAQNANLITGYLTCCPRMRSRGISIGCDKGVSIARKRGVITGILQGSAFTRHLIVGSSIVGSLQLFAAQGRSERDFTVLRLAVHPVVHTIAPTKGRRGVLAAVLCEHNTIAIVIDETDRLATGKTFLRNATTGIVRVAIGKETKDVFPFRSISALQAMGGFGRKHQAKAVVMVVHVVDTQAVGTIHTDM